MTRYRCVRVFAALLIWFPFFDVKGESPLGGVTPSYGRACEEMFSRLISDEVVEAVTAQTREWPWWGVFIPELAINASIEKGITKDLENLSDSIGESRMEAFIGIFLSWSPPHRGTASFEQRHYSDDDAELGRELRRQDSAVGQALLSSLLRLQAHWLDACKHPTSRSLEAVALWSFLNNHGVLPASVVHP